MYFLNCSLINSESLFAFYSVSRVRRVGSLVVMLDCVNLLVLGWGHFCARWRSFIRFFLTAIWRWRRGWRLMCGGSQLRFFLNFIASAGSRWDYWDRRCYRFGWTWSEFVPGRIWWVGFDEFNGFPFGRWDRWGRDGSRRNRRRPCSWLRLREGRHEDSGRTWVSIFWYRLWVTC